MFCNNLSNRLALICIRLTFTCRYSATSFWRQAFIRFFKRLLFCSGSVFAMTYKQFQSVWWPVFYTWDPGGVSGTHDLTRRQTLLIHWSCWVMVHKYTPAYFTAFVTVYVIFFWYFPINEFPSRSLWILFLGRPNIRLISNCRNITAWCRPAGPYSFPAPQLKDSVNTHPDLIKLLAQNLFRLTKSAGFSVTTAQYPQVSTQIIWVVSKASKRSWQKTVFTREDIVVAFGGGVIGDLADLQQPLTRAVARSSTFPPLLAMIDSSIAENGHWPTVWKNLVEPSITLRAVIADLELLESFQLPFARWSCGTY